MAWKIWLSYLLHPSSALILVCWTILCHINISRFPSIVKINLHLIRIGVSVILLPFFAYRIGCIMMLSLIFGGIRFRSALISPGIIEPLCIGLCLRRLWADISSIITILKNKGRVPEVAQNSPGRGRITPSDIISEILFIAATPVLSFGIVMQITCIIDWNGRSEMNYWRAIMSGDYIQLTSFSIVFPLLAIAASYYIRKHKKFA
jgi:hypothetical protein